MIYTQLTVKAMDFAYKHHHSQYDKAGAPYIFHPMHLAEQMDDELSVCTALLHDTIEDTDATEEELRELFGDEIATAVALLSRNDDEDYFDYVKRVKKNPLAAKVKMADLEHNSDLSRLPEITEKAIRRTEKYKKAIALLKE